jgi:hypothetical protein
VDGTYQIGTLGGAASGIAGAATQTSTQVGASTLSAQASAATDALARFGVTGVSLVANAGAHADINFDIGPGYVMFGVQSDAKSENKVGVTGLVLSSGATAGAYTSSGVGGSLGGAGTGSVSGTTGVFAYARSDNKYTYENGKIVLAAEEAIGVGASAGGTGSISGSAGRLDAGATIYSPGSLGGKFAWNAGVGDGKLAIGLDLGAQIGIGGLGVNIAFTIDFAETFRAIDSGLDAMSNDPVMRTVVNEVASWFGVPPMRTPAPPPPSASQIAAKAAAEQRVKDLARLKQDFEALVILQRDTQSGMLNQLRDNPQAAADYAQAGHIQKLQREHTLLVHRAGQLGLQLAVVDGKMVFVPKT